MKQRVIFILALFFSFVLLFAVQKPLFMLYNYPLAREAAFGEWLAVIWHGLSLDMTVAGYLTIIPALICILSIWWSGGFWRKILKVYIIVVSVVVAAVFAVDMALYPYWGFRVDASIWFYLASPREAMASVTFWETARQILIGIAYGIGFNYFLGKLILPLFDGSRPPKKLLSTVVGTLLLCLLFIPIRGGFGASTANEGRVYFSANQFLNHAAVNPVFSLLNSSLRTQKYSDEYRYFDEAERERIFSQLICQPDPENDGGISEDSILNTNQPNIVLLILESFSANLVEPLGGMEGVTPALNRLAGEGVLFTRMYANSFRTDRGLVSILNAFPGQPKSTIMKHPSKSQTLPSIARTLKDNGYSTAVYYGGDIDFTNMRSYFYGSGYDVVTGQDKLRFSAKPGQWGYDDSVMFPYLADEVESAAREHQPFFITFLTMSSHEPFDVPFDKFENPYVNSVAFADREIGGFVERLKESGVWENTLLILVSDHSFRYPYDVQRNSPEQVRIPMVWAGGAVAARGTNDRISTQADIAATLLGRLSLPYDEFTYSKDLFRERCPEFAFYTYNNGFAFIDSTGVTNWDLNSGTAVDIRGEEGNENRLRKGRAFLQTLMEDFDSR